MGSPLTAVPYACRVGKIAFFDRSKSLLLRRFTAENSCPSVTMVCVHDGALAEEACQQQRWLSWKSVYHTAHFSVTCMRHGTSHARFAMVEPIATMRVQNYAGRRIKSGSCWKCSSGWHGGSVCVICKAVSVASIRCQNWGCSNAYACQIRKVKNDIITWRHEMTSPALNKID